MKELEKMFKVLSNRNRMRILKMLERKDMCVCEVTAILGIKQPSVTAHLVKLKDAGIIAERQKGLYTEFFIKSRNPATDIWKVLSGILDNEPQVKKDLVKSRTIDRYEICSAKRTCR